MADSFIRLPVDGVGKLLDTSQLTVGSNVVQRERMIIGDNVNNNYVIVSSTGGALVDQGAAAAAAGAWPVEVTDGTNVLGTPTHPIRTDPTGTTVQPVSLTSTTITGNVAVTSDGTFEVVQDTAADFNATVVFPSAQPVTLTSTTVTGTVAVAPALNGTLTDKSGTVATGGTSQALASSNANRKFLLIENPANATETLYINFTTAASTSAKNSVELVPGGSLQLSLATYITTEAINVTAVTTSHAFIAKEG